MQQRLGGPKGQKEQVTDMVGLSREESGEFKLEGGYAFQEGPVTGTEGCSWDLAAGFTSTY